MLKEYVKDKALEEKISDIGARQLQRIVEQYGDSTGIQPKYTAMGRTFSAHTFKTDLRYPFMREWDGLGDAKSFNGARTIGDN